MSEMTQQEINNSSMLKVGTILHGSYRIEDYLASGGFGNTYRVMHVELGEYFAIKEFYMKGVSEREEDSTTVRVSNTQNRTQFASQLRKFKKEALRLRKLNNPHIVHVHDLFEENGTAYYVMDLIDGISLSAHLKQKGRPMSEEEVWNIMPQILQALDTVHTNGFQHLDLKPGNIMIDKRGSVTLIDFGASKQLDVEEGVSTSSALAYTPGYAPREQMEQNLNKLGPWTDLYALGATFYNLLSNKKPPLPSDIDDEHELAFLFPKHVSDRMRQLILWMMTPQRDRRPQSIADVRTHIEEKERDDVEAMTDEQTVVETFKPASCPQPNTTLQPETTIEKKRYVKYVIIFATAVFMIGVITWWSTPGTLIITSSPSGAKINVYGGNPVNGGYMGETPLTLERQPGRYSVTFSAEGYESKTQSVTVTAGKTATCNVTLRRKQVQQPVSQQPASTTTSSASSQTFTVNGVSFNMIRVEGGTFQMGATAEQGSDVYKDEKPVHSVTLSSYTIGQTEVTQALWAAVMGSNPSNWKGDNLPVENVSWNDCQTFITKLNQLIGQKFRLPTEAEWEYAARGGKLSKGYKYSGSNTLADVAWNTGNSSDKTHPVATKKPNELGLYDMSGNVFEWCQDWYDENYYKKSPSNNPTGPSSGSSRGNRGGSRVSYRGFNAPSCAFYSLGFRLALSAR